MQLRPTEGSPAISVLVYVDEDGDQASLTSPQHSPSLGRDLVETSSRDQQALRRSGRLARSRRTARAQALIHCDESLAEAISTTISAGKSRLTVTVRSAAPAKAAAKQPATPEAQPPAAAFIGGVIAASSLAATIGLVAVKAASAARR